MEMIKAESAGEAKVSLRVEKIENGNTDVAKQCDQIAIAADADSIKIVSEDNLWATATTIEIIEEIATHKANITVKSSSSDSHAMQAAAKYDIKYIVVCQN